MLKFLTDPAPIDRRPAGQVVASETYLVAYTHRDDARGTPAQFGAASIGQTFRQAMDEIEAKLAAGYAVERVVKVGAGFDVCEDVTKAAAQAFDKAVGDWAESGHARELDEFCERALGYSPLRLGWLDADFAPPPGSLNGRSHDGSRGALMIWGLAFASCLAVLVATGGA